MTKFAVRGGLLWSPSPARVLGVGQCVARMTAVNANMTGTAANRVSMHDVGGQRKWIRAGNESCRRGVSRTGRHYPALSLRLRIADVLVHCAIAALSQNCP